MDGSWWRVLTKHGPQEKAMANHSVFLPWEPHEQYEKANTQNREEKVLVQIPFLLYACYQLSCFNHVQLFATCGLWPTRLLCSWDSVGKNTSLLSCPLPGDRPNPGAKSSPPVTPALAYRFFTTSTTYMIPNKNLNHCFSNCFLVFKEKIFIMITTQFYKD